MTKQQRIFIALLFILGAMGFLLSFWPLEALAVILGAVGGQYVFALGFGILLDLAYGTPPGLLHFLFFPFTLLAAVGILARAVGGKYIFQHSKQNKI